MDNAYNGSVLHHIEELSKEVLLLALLGLGSNTTRLSGRNHLPRSADIEFLRLLRNLNLLEGLKNI